MCPFCGCLLWFIITFLRFIDIVVCVSVLHSFLWQKKIPFYVYNILFMFSSVDGRLGRFPFLAFVNSAAMNVCVEVFL